jgi:hypothetical protein
MAGARHFYLFELSKLTLGLTQHPVVGAQGMFMRGYSGPLILSTAKVRDDCCLSTYCFHLNAQHVLEHLIEKHIFTSYLCLSFLIPFVHLDLNIMPLEATPLLHFIVQQYHGNHV